MAQYETRSWVGWHHHMTLVALAHLFVTLTRQRLEKKSPELTLDRTVRLLEAALEEPELRLPRAIALVDYHVRRNKVARKSHDKTWQAKHRGRQIPAAVELVLLLAKLALNCRMFSEPLTHLLIGPCPFKGVGVPMVVFRPRSQDMRLEFLLTLPRRTFQVIVLERMDEDLRLVQPRGIGGCIARLPPALALGEVPLRASRLCDSTRHPGSRRRRATPCGAGERVPIQEGSAHGRSSPGTPTPSTRYARPGTPTCSPSHAGCSRTPVARSTQGSLGGSGHAPGPGRLGSHRHTRPRCPVPPSRAAFP